MSSYIAIGKSRKKVGLMIDFRKKRAYVRAQTQWIQGVALEKMQEGISGYAPGIVLIHGDWKNIYFVNEREGWDEEDYFSLAHRKFSDLGIEYP